MIELSAVRKVYGKKDTEFIAVNNVSFTIPSGATVAIVGKSGSGKSTLMHIMSGLDRPTSGVVKINGVSLADMKRKQMDSFRATQMGFVFQSFFVEANQSCYQNVVLPLEIKETSFRTRRSRVLRALEQVELSDKVNARARDLSGGQKQRLAIARAIVNRPKIIFADEPTGNLDSTTSANIERLLFGIHNELGSTLVIVTHDRELADRCDMQIHMKDGEVVEASAATLAVHKKKRSSA